MTPNDAARVLAKAAAVDQRTVGDADVLAWYEILADLDPQDCLDAVKLHYAESTDRLMPAHVRRRALAIRRHRDYLVREAEATEKAALEAAGQGPRGATEDRSADVVDLVRRVTDRIGTGDPDALRRPEWVEHERRQRRARRADAEPNPHYWARQPGGTPPDLSAGEVS